MNGERFELIVKRYERFLATFGSGTMVIFDGYQYNTIKDHEHQRRGGKMGSDVTVRPQEIVTFNRDPFLKNDKNKVAFIQLLSEHLQNSGYRVLESDGDADVLIVQTAIKFASEGQEVSVIAEDTDIFVLLLHHFQENMAEVIFSERKLIIWKRW